MLMMIGFAVLSTSSLAVASFAWFTASTKASANFSNLTVLSPDSVVLYAYKGNPDPSYVPEKDGNKFDDDFVPLDNNTQESIRTQYADFNGMYPGKAMTFAFKIENKSSAALSITKLTSNDALLEGLKGTDNQHQYRYVANSTPSELINIGWAMDIYVTTLTSDSGYSSFANDPSNNYAAEDKFLYGSDAVVESKYRKETYLAGTTANNVITLTNQIPLFSSDELDADATTYLFFSVLFSDHDSTYYQEVNGNSGTATDLDVIPTSGDRYFRKTTSGNSNCYSNLTFAINELSLR
ncbi:MAG: hypothetical protein E7182_06305 [Erysipelotrichaceae bacterium]|nr:hypothetical protein [Erysipelotrichaceae bacterium]